MRIFKTWLTEEKKTKEVDAVEAWMVTWKSRAGQFSSDTRDEAKVFVEESAANEFASSLKRAHKLLRNSCSIGIRVKGCTP